MICDIQYGTASFKGVEFEILPVRMTMGQRKITHLYPFWDAHYNEALGKKPTRWEVQGAFIGSNFRDQIARAIQRWSNCDPGRFYEPTLNTFYNVQLAEDFTLQFDHKSLNRVEFTLELIEAATQPFPSQNGRTVIRQSVDRAVAAARASYTDATPYNEVLSGLDAASDFGRVYARIYDQSVGPDYTP